MNLAVASSFSIGDRVELQRIADPNSVLFVLWFGTLSPGLVDALRLSFCSESCRMRRLSSVLLRSFKFETRRDLLTDLLRSRLPVIPGG
jgi:hypothetical protein